MVKIAVCGARGRMGKAILGIAESDQSIRIVGQVEAAAKLHRAPLAPASVEADDQVDLVDDLTRVVDKADVVIDFTSPEAAIKNAVIAAAAGKAMVVGTTGLVGALREKFVAAVKSIPCVLSSNMSLSANVMFDAAERVARALPGYDNEIVEIHHNLKKDSPSGTAQTLAESVKKGKGAGAFVYGRHGLVGERKEDEIGVHAVRGGDVVGDHTVLFLGAGERIELVHRVTSREAFAGGAVAAAKWLAGKPAGLYDMRDVLGLK